MENREYETARQHLLNAAMVLAPNGQIQREFVALSEDADLLKEDNPGKARCRALTGAIYDGLAYGNWPGIKI